MISILFLFIITATSTPIPPEQAVLAALPSSLHHFSEQTGTCQEHEVHIVKKNGVLTLDGIDAEQTPWSKIFFIPPGKGAEQDRKNFIRLLSSFGIDAAKQTVDVAWPGGPIVIVFGRQSHNDNGPYLSVYRSNHLPAELHTANGVWRFVDYHKSVLPLSFPGKVLTVTGENSTEQCRFLRKEYLK